MARATILLCVIGAVAVVSPGVGSLKWGKSTSKETTSSRRIGSSLSLNLPHLQRTQSLPVFSSRKTNSNRKLPSDLAHSTLSLNALGNKGRGKNKNQGGNKSTWKKIAYGASVVAGIAEVVPVAAGLWELARGDAQDSELIFTDADFQCPGQHNTKSNLVSEVTYKAFDASGVQIENKNIHLNSSQPGNDHIVVVGAVSNNKILKSPQFTTSYLLYYEGKKEIASYSCHEVDGSTKEDFSESITKVNNSELITLIRGQLVPKYDFVGSTLQHQTDIDENSVLQWSSINKGNWNIVERAVRKLAQSKKMKLYVVTGTWGVFQRKLRGNKSNGELSVPALFWKLVYEPQSRTGVIIFVSNNPFHSFRKLNITPCTQKSVCNNLNSWLKFNNQINNVTHGEVECCKINEVNSALKLNQIINVYNHADLLN